MNIQLAEGKKVYFASDQHFGAPTREKSREREEKFVAWLRSIQDDGQVLFLMGDLFDFWHEWDEVVPKYFVRVLGKLAELRDSGVEVFFFVGNHDLWMRDYFEKELGIPVFHHKKMISINGKTFLLAHGDGLGPGDKGYKRMKRLFTNPFCQFLFKWLHPDLAMKIASYLSLKNKLISGEEDQKFLGEDKEYLIQYANKKIKEQDIDFLVFGHRHLPMVLTLNNQHSQYINLGDWINYFTYGVYDGKNFNLEVYNPI